MEVNQYAKKIREKYPNFKIALGNEIYLVDERKPGQKYYHFILIAKDLYGHQGLHELSSAAWYGMYNDRNMDRVPLLKSELKDIMQKYKGHIIATTACIGGELSTKALAMVNAQKKDDMETATLAYQDICTFIQYCKDIFGDDFYIECAPSAQQDQITVNQKLFKIAQNYHIPMVVATDSHYLTRMDRPIHKAYLNSKDGDREVDLFYEFTYLMDEKECRELLNKSFNNDEIINWIFQNTLKIKDKIQDYSLEKVQSIPKVEVVFYPQRNQCEEYPILHQLFMSENPQERAWVNECVMAMHEKKLTDKIYYERLETEANVILTIGNKLHDCLFAYFNTFKHYIDLFWECGSIVGPGRGSATGFLSNYLLGITQLEPVRWSLQYWRFLNLERVELPDIDIDLAPSRRPAIFEAIRRERGEYGLVQVAAFGTEGTKSAILTACRGYRTEDFPEGIDVDTAQYMSSLIPQHRGFLWPLKDVIYGNPEEDRAPVKPFIHEVEQYPGLLDIMLNIEGVVNKRTIHASGVILYDKDHIFETASVMRAPSGELITCYDLLRAESAGDVKYDFLATEACDKIIQCYNLLSKYNEIPQMGLRDFYNQYLHPEVLNTKDQRIWDHLSAGDVLDVFQFSTGVGLAVAKKLKPQNPIEMTAANALMRLMSEKGQESQQDRYCRIQKVGIKAFDDEMRQHNLSEDIIQKLHKHCDRYYGCCALQEQMMEILMDVAGFSLAEANAARKVVAKKQMDKIPALKEQLFSRFDDAKVAEYIWEVVVAPSLGYAFSLNHSLPYSFVGIQMIYLAINFNPIYWDTACLIVNSGSLEQLPEEEEIVNIYEPEDFSEYEYEDLPDRSGKKKRRRAATDYGKIAKAIGDIQSAGIKVSLADINCSAFGFAPDVENNQILFGLKGILNVGDDIVQDIINNRPYVSIKDFLAKVKIGRRAMVSLIKSGAFDSMEDRKFAMAWYIWQTCDKKNRITLQNMASLIKYDILPKDDSMVLASRVYEFTRYLKKVCKKMTLRVVNKQVEFYILDDRAVNFINELHDIGAISFNAVEYCEQFIINTLLWDKFYQSEMNIVRDYITKNQSEVLNSLNKIIFAEDWNNYAKGTISAWEMEVLCFYYHEHELAHLPIAKYGISDFSKLPTTPIVDKTFKRNGREIPLFKLSRICGTCIAKNKTKSTVTLLTTSGVVELKFRKELFALFDKQISERGADGCKHVKEKGWFNRGNMIIVTGVRVDDVFLVKKYSSTPGHTLYKIDSINDKGEVNLISERYSSETA
jgi:DNA polymerase-3 subunit alpha